MSISRDQLSEIVREVSQLLFFLAAPVVVGLAWRGWHMLRGGLAPWRRILGAISLAFISTSWLFVILLLVVSQINRPWANSFPGESLLLSIFWGDVTATVLASTLAGRPRLLAILGGLLLVGFWLSSVVH